MIKTSYHVANGLMYSDPNRIKQILMNLLSNSLKFTERGTISVIIHQYNNSEESLLKIEDAQSLNGNQQSQSNELVTITVADTGVGIPDSVKPKLFKMFGTFELKQGLNRHGTGLGLVICKKLVGLLGPTDEIHLESQEGKGSKFSFSIYLNNDHQNCNTTGQNNQLQEYVTTVEKKKDGIQSSHVMIFTKPLTMIR